MDKPTKKIRKITRAKRNKTKKDRKADQQFRNSYLIFYAANLARLS